MRKALAAVGIAILIVILAATTVAVSAESASARHDTNWPCPAC